MPRHNPPDHPGNEIRILDWKPTRKGKLHGFAKAELSSGMVLSDVTIINGDLGLWASLPGKPMVGQGGTAIRGLNGKTKYSAIIEFTSKAIRDRFSADVIDAMRTAHTQALS